MESVSRAVRSGPVRALAVAFALILTAGLVGSAGPRRASGPAAQAGAPGWAAEPSDAQLAAVATGATGAGGSGGGARDGSGRAEQFYFVLPDRFADADPGNDTGGLTGDRLDTGYDPTDKRFYHGGDLKGVLSKLDYIQGLGTTAIWLAPVFTNRPVQGSGADASAGYHGYWITDFTQVDPHFGSNEDLKALVRAAHRRDIKIYLDVIVNHTADVIDYAGTDHSYVDTETKPYLDAAGQPFDDRNYSDGSRDFPAVDRDSFPYTPTFASPADATVKKPAWLNDPTMYHNRGDSTFSGENSEYGDFYGLDDLWTERPEVVRGMTRIYQDWIGATGVDGFRLDTTKHVDMDFWPQFSQGIEQYAAAHGKPGFFMFGEVYSADPQVTSSYVRTGQLPATLDFGFQAAASSFVTGTGSASQLAELYAADPLYTARDTSANRLTTFLGNHDMGRIGGMLTGASGLDPASLLRRDILAHELMFFSRGQPVVYAGDEQGFTGAGGDADARQDMFASQVADYLDDDLIGTDRTHAVDQFDPDHPLYRTIAQLSRLRADYPGLRDGVQVTRTPVEPAGDDAVFAFSRTDPDERVEYLVAVNSADTARQVRVPTYRAGATFHKLYPAADAALRSATDTTVTVTVPALSTVVYRADRPLPRPSAAPRVRITAPAAGAPVATQATVTAEVTGGDPLATVTVAAQAGTGRWQLLGTATGTVTDPADPTAAPGYALVHDLTGLAGGLPVRYKAVVRDSAGRTGSDQATATVATPAVAASRDWLVVHYDRDDERYADWNLYAWGDIDASAQTPWPSGQPFDGTDSYGRFAWVRLAPNAASVGFLVVNADGVKDVATDRTVDVTATGEIWLKSGDPTVYPTRQSATGEPDPPVDTGTAVLHYRRADGDYDGWGLHLWDGAAEPTDWSAPLAPAGRDAYGLTFRVPLAAGATGLSYIVHRGDTKDLPADQRLEFAASGYEVWLLAGTPGYLVPVPSVGSGAAPTDADLGRAEAQWIDRGTVAWLLGDTDGRRYDLVTAPAGGLGVADGELTGSYTTIALDAGRNGLTEAQRQAFPNLWQYQALHLRAPVGTLRGALRGQLAVTERDHTGKLLRVTGVQLPGVLDDLYAGAERATLGPTFDGRRPSLALWAPTATEVVAELYETPQSPARTVAMRRDEATGVWRVTGERGWYGHYYRYRVTVWQPAVRQMVTASVTDPYSVSLAADSTHSQLVDLSDPALAPAGWGRLAKPAAVPAARTQIQELSVRDFSIADPTVPADHRGTFLAFTDTGSAGMTHLRELAGAGVTHVHLLPAFDFASIPERRADQAEPACDLPALPPDSERQQQCVAAVADTDGYNWGYDPLHYTVPEGGYATDPDGAARVGEYRRMVAGLNGAGLRVVMDVVYNHTSAAGVADGSILDQIVPGYYHRLLSDGSVANSTCCANTAPEHTMMGKLVVDSVVTWAKQYKVDGFRFDLMGHHPKENILAVRRALDALTVAHDGVDGRSIYVYGEGWDFGEVAGGARFVQATQANMAGTGIGTFNDRLRDAVRGGGPFDDDPRVQGFASGLYTDPNGDPINGTRDEQRARLLHLQDLIKVGLAGNLAGYTFVDSSGHPVSGAQVDYNGSPAGYTGSPGESVTYVDAHDNEILYDALAYKLPQSTSDAERARAQVLALSTVVLGQGVGFVTAGSDRLRSKSLDRNSYNSGDWFNQIRWDCAAGNGFGAGLPPAADNEAKWGYARPLLADPALVPGCAAVRMTAARYQELLRVRASSPLFSLGSAQQVQRRLSFPLSGTAAELPGVITMRLDGAGLGGYRSVTVVFNATTATVTQRLDALRGADVTLHPVLRASADPVLRSSSFERGTGTFTVPARSVAVFVQS